MKNKFKEKKEKLYNTYDRFERENMPYSQQALCKAGCSFCCTFMGNIDIVTLEGLIILEHIGSQPDEFQAALKNKLKPRHHGVLTPWVGRGLRRPAPRRHKVPAAETAGYIN